MAVVEPDSDGAIGDGFVQDEIEVSVVIEIDREEDRVARDGEAGDVRTVVAVEVGESPDGGGRPCGKSPECDKEERFHLS